MLLYRLLGSSNKCNRLSCIDFQQRLNQDTQ